MNGYSPQVDKDKQDEVEDLVQWKEQRVYVVGEALQKAIDGVKGMAGKRSRDLPSVVTLVNVLVHQSVMQPAVNPVDKCVREH